MGKNTCYTRKYIEKTSYFHVVPAYMSVLQYAYNKNNDITWFCLLTEACVPLYLQKNSVEFLQIHINKVF